MKRRKFLSSAALLAASTALAAPRTPGTRSDAFKQALTDKPWLSGYRSAQRDAFTAPATVSGNWPTDLVGTFYRNGPARHEIGNYRYAHWFDGDGMLQAYRLGPAGVSHQAKFVQTYKLQAERRAGRALYPGFASVPPDPAPVTSPDAVNVANISVLHHHGKLFALWEAGSPWEMDPATLDTKGTYAFSDHTRGVPFSAHPRVEADGTLWNFGYLSSAKLLVLWHINADGRLIKAGKVPVDPISMPHDFIVTARHLLIMVPPLHYEPDSEVSTFLDAHQWHPELPTRLLVVDKNDFDNHFWLELPAQWVFHYGNGWEDDSGIIRFDAARAPDPLAMINTFRDIMQGDVSPSSPSHHHEYRVDTRTRTITEAPMFSHSVDSEFPCVDPRVSCRRNELLTMLTRDVSHPAPHPSLNALTMFDYASGKRTTFHYPDTQMPEEHLFVPKPGSPPETLGWVVGTALDWRRQQTLLNVFDARGVDDGPIATATLPYALPLGLHGKFVAG